MYTCRTGDGEKRQGKRYQNIKIQGMNNYVNISINSIKKNILKKTEKKTKKKKKKHRCFSKGFPFFMDHVPLTIARARKNIAPGTQSNSRTD
jgi:hypothetical protein